MTNELSRLRNRNTLFRGKKIRIYELRQDCDWD